VVCNDPILCAFLERQTQEGLELAAGSDILDLECLPTGQHFIAHFSCRGLVKELDGTVQEASGFHVGLFLGADYLRTLSHPYEVVTLISPFNVFHPNVAAPFICLGRIVPGTPLVDLLFEAHEVLSGQKVTMREEDALNREACSWYRANQSRLPVDPRPLLRRLLALEIEPV